MMRRAVINTVFTSLVDLITGVVTATATSCRVSLYFSVSLSPSLSVCLCLLAVVVHLPDVLYGNNLVTLIFDLWSETLSQFLLDMDSIYVKILSFFILFHS